MAVLPSFQDMPGATGIRAINPRPSYQVPSFGQNPIPRALESLGSDMNQLGGNIVREDRYNARLQKSDDAQAVQEAKFQANDTYSQFHAQQLDALQTAAENAGPGAIGFTKKFMEQHDAAGQQMWGGFGDAPEKVMAPLSVTAQRDRQWFQNKAMAFERQQGKVFYDGSVKDFVTTLSTQITKDSSPANFSEMVKRGEEQIDRLPPYFTDADRRKYDSAMRIGLLRSYALAHPTQWGDNFDAFKNSPAAQELMKATPEYVPAGGMGDQSQNGQQSSLQPFLQSRWAAGASRAPHFDVEPEFGARLQTAIADAEQATGSKASIRSLRRTNAEQADAYRNYKLGGGLAAAPKGMRLADGSIAPGSRHENGQAADLQSGPVLDWLHQNAGKYGLEFLPGNAGRVDPGHIQINRNDSRAMAQRASGPVTVEALWPRLTMRESGNDQSAVSPKGATGISQVMPATGPEAAQLAGLPWDEQRFHNDQSYNEALGKAYLGQQLNDFGGDAVKALSAYNAGPTRTRDAIQQYGSQWLSHMPGETQKYVKKILGTTQTASAASPAMAPDSSTSGGTLVASNDPSIGTDVAAGDPASSDAADGSQTAQAEPTIPADAGIPGIFHGVPQSAVDRINKEVAQQQRALHVQETAALKGKMELGIETGSVRDNNDILNSALPDGDKATLLRRLNEKNKTGDAVINVGDALQNNTYLDTTDSAVKKGVNALFNATAGTPGQPASAAQNLVSGDPRAAQVMFWMWGRTSNVMPDDAKAALQSMARSPDDAQVSRGLGYLSALQQQNPVAFSQVFPGMEDKVATYNDRVATDNPAQIAAQIRQQDSPEWKKTYKPAYEAALTKARTDYDTAKVTALFDTRSFMNTGGWNFSNAPEQPPLVRDTAGSVLGNPMSMTVDFQKYFAEASANGVGDPEKAALQKLQNVWNVSPVNGNVIMKYPPEIYYKAKGMATDWMQGNIEDTLKSLGYTIKSDAGVRGRGMGQSQQQVIQPYTILPIPGKTAEQIASGKLPQYQIMVMRDDGTYDIARNKDGVRVIWPAQSDFATTKANDVANAKDRSDSAKRMIDAVKTGGQWGSTAQPPPMGEDFGGIAGSGQ